MSFEYLPLAFRDGNSDPVMKDMLGDGVRIKTAAQTSEICHCCNTKITYQKAIVADGKTYIAVHFMCHKCDRPITGRYALDGGKFICERCGEQEELARNRSQGGGNDLKPTGQRHVVGGGSASPPGKAQTSPSAGGVVGVKKTTTVMQTVAHEREGERVATSGPDGSSVFVDKSLAEKFAEMCAVCGDPIFEGEILVNGVPHHAACVPAEAFSPKTSPRSAGNSKVCGGCSQAITSGKTVSALGSTFHKDCFKCVMCKKAITGSFADRGGQPACETCAKNNPQVTTTSTVTGVKIAPRVTGYGIRDQSEEEIAAGLRKANIK